MLLPILQFSICTCYLRRTFICIDDKSYNEYFHSVYSAFLFIIFLITLESCHIIVKFH